MLCIFGAKLQSCDLRFVHLSESHEHIVLREPALQQIQFWQQQDIG